MNSKPEKAIDTVQHLVGTRYVPSVEPYMRDMTGAACVRQRRLTREARYSMVEYDLDASGIISRISVYP